MLFRSQAVGVARHAILQTLGLLGLIATPPKPEPQQRDILRLVDVTDRAHPDDRFVREWRSFDVVKAGETVALRHDGAPVIAPTDGFIVFPNPRSEAGQEWFYFAQQRA